MRRIALLCCLAGLTGCMTLGRPFDVSKAGSIRVGKTTEADLKALFGEPYRRGLEDGDATATWLHYRLRVLGGHDTRDLYVRFSPDGTVKTYSLNSNIPEDQEALK